jgi:hypothetical protein
MDQVVNFSKHRLYVLRGVGTGLARARQLGLYLDVSRVGANGAAKSRPTPVDCKPAVNAQTPCCHEIADLD